MRTTLNAIKNIYFQQKKYNYLWKNKQMHFIYK